MMFQRTFKTTVCIALTSLMIASCSAFGTPAETSENSRKARFSEPTTTETSETDITNFSSTDTESSETSESVEHVYNGHYKKAAWRIEPTVIYDNRNVKITAEELLNTQRYSSVCISFWIENNSDDDLSFTVKELGINTLCSRVLYYEPLTVKGHSCDTFFTWVNLDYLKSFGIEDIGRVDVALKGTNQNGYDAIDPDPVTIYTDHKDSMQMPSLPDSDPILDDDNIYACISTSPATDSMPPLFMLFVTNKSDSNITVKTKRLWFGGKDLKGGIMITIPAGMSRDVYYSFEDEVIKSSVSSATITQMEISLTYHIPGKYKSETESPVVSLSVN